MITPVYRGGLNPLDGEGRSSPAGRNPVVSFQAERVMLSLRSLLTDLCHPSFKGPYSTFTRSTTERRQRLPEVQVFCDLTLTKTLAGRLKLDLSERNASVPYDN